MHGTSSGLLEDLPSVKVEPRRAVPRERRPARLVSERAPQGPDPCSKLKERKFNRSTWYYELVDVLGICMLPERASGARTSHVRRSRRTRAAASAFPAAAGPRAYSTRIYLMPKMVHSGASGVLVTQYNSWCLRSPSQVPHNGPHSLNAPVQVITGRRAPLPPLRQCPAASPAGVV